MKMLRICRYGATVFLLLSILVLTGAEAAWVGKGPTGTSVNSVLCSGSSPGVIFAGTSGGVYKSPGTNPYGDAWFYKGFRNFWIKSIASTGTSCGSTLLAGAGPDIYSSATGGDSWSLFSSLPGDVTAMGVNAAVSCTGYAGFPGGIVNTLGRTGLGSNRINAIAADSSGNVYAATDGNGVWKTTDNGLTWTEFNTGLTSPMVKTLRIDSANNIFAGTVGGGVFMYPSSGASWTQRVNGLPVFSGIANYYIVTTLVKSNSVLYAGVITGAPITGAVYSSTDNGQNWTLLDGLSGASPASVCATPAPDYNSLFVGTNRGVFRLDLPSANPATTPRDQTGLFSAAPFNSTFASVAGYIFAGSGSMGVYKSSDNGETWVTSWTGSNPSPQNVNALVRDPGGVLYASAGDISGIYKSINSGQDWALASTGLPTVDLYGYAMYVEGTAMAVDGTGTVYAGLDDGRVYSSVNQGGNWVATTGLGTTARISSMTRGAVRDNDTTIYAGTEGDGIFKTTNGGVSWNVVNTGLPQGAQVIDGSLYVDVATGDIYAGVIGGGLFRSVDAGGNWNKVTIFSDPQHCSNSWVKSVVFDTSRNLYSLICSGEVLVSGDMGANWIDISAGLQPLDALEGINARGLFVDSNNNLFASTISSGIQKYTKEFARVAGAASTHSTILEAYNAVTQPNDIVQLLALNFSENLVLGTAGQVVTLRGGLGTGFGPTIGLSTIRGSLTISQGTVTVDGIVVI